MATAVVSLVPCLSVGRSIAFSLPHISLPLSISFLSISIQV